MKPLFLLGAFLGAVAWTCEPSAFAKLSGLPSLAAETREFQPRSLEELGKAFRDGLIVDFNDPQQRRAFAVYRSMYFGDPKTSLNEDTNHELAAAQTAHPQLTKHFFRQVNLSMTDRAPVHVPELVVLRQGWETAQERLLQPQLYLDSWTELLGKAALAKGLGEMPREGLWETLKQEHEKAGDPSRRQAVAQAMVDFVTATTLKQLPDRVRQLSSADSREQSNALRALLDALESRALELGYAHGFEGFLEAMGGCAPSFFPDGAKARALLSAARRRSESAPVLGSPRLRTLRSLSLTEAPFRSCLGGSDCSSRTYLTRALQENYHYFTLTDDKGHSSGQVTVVLGTSDGKRVAFVDKIQNVDLGDLEAMLEAMRRTLASDGYELVIPLDLGDHNGISNVSAVRTAVAQLAGFADQKLESAAFVPHAVEAGFPNRFSRAENGLKVKALLPLSGNAHSFELGDRVKPWRARSLSIDSLIDSISKLREGTPDDKLRYIPAMEPFAAMDFEWKQQFQATIARFVADPKEALKVRKRALMYLLEHGDIEAVAKGLYEFKPLERVDIVQNLLQQPKFRDRILGDPAAFLDHVLANENLTFDLMQRMSPQNLGAQWVRILKELPPGYENFMKSLAVLGDYENCEELQAVVHLMHEQLGKQARATVQAVTDRLRARNFALVSPRALQSELSAWTGIPLADGGFIAVGQFEDLRWFDASGKITGERAKSADYHLGDILHLGDGKLVRTTGAGRVEWLDPTGKVTASYLFPPTYPVKLRADGEGGVYAIPINDTAPIVQLRNGKIISESPPKMWSVHHSALPDGTLVATANEGDSLHWVKDGKIIHTVDTIDSFLAMTAMPDGTLVAYTQSNRLLWFKNGQEVANTTLGAANLANATQLAPATDGTLFAPRLDGRVSWYDRGREVAHLDLKISLGSLVQLKDGVYAAFDGKGSIVWFTRQGVLGQSQRSYYKQPTLVALANGKVAVAERGGNGVFQIYDLPKPLTVATPGKERFDAEVLKAHLDVEPDFRGRR